jgi:prolyl oligopeptidase
MLGSMRAWIAILLLLGACLLPFTGCMSNSHTPASAAASPCLPLSYPLTAKGDVVDDYHGTPIADPYRWLEDPDSAQTKAWVAAENKVTHAFLDALPARGEIEKRMTQLWNFERWGIPQHKAGKYLYSRNDGLQNQAVLYVTEALESAPRVLLDPNMLSKDGTTALGDIELSEDGRYLAYMLSEAGSDWNRIQVRDVASGKDLPDRIEWVKFSGLSWTHDGRGFYYSTFPEHDRTGKVALKNHKLFFHELGSAAAQDRVVYERPDQPEWGFGGVVSDDGTLLVIVVSQGTEQRTRIYAQDLAQAGQPVTPLLDAFDAEYRPLGKRGSKLLLQTDKDAARGRIVAFDLATHALQEIVPESPDTLESARLAGGRLVCVYMKHAQNELCDFELDGKPAGRPALPGIGSVAGIEGRQDEDEAFLSFSSFARPPEIWRYRVGERRMERVFAPKVGFSPEEYVTRQVFYPSKDGTRVPLFICHLRGLRPGPETRCLLYGYGGFDIPLKPDFRVANLVWMERGGVFALACIRGGGEYGREWHEAGTKERKQNVFDDFIGAAEWLAANRYTSPPHLAIRGGSNGGLLVGACMTQRPELFGCCLPAVGVLDMLRYQRFTIGWAWASDYGSAEDPQAFRYLLRYSPLHNLAPGAHYPPTLITTGDHDDRVVPAHSFKFASALQAAQGGDDPVLIRIETRGGHGAGKPTAMQIEELADQWSFAEWALERAQPGGG